MKKIISLFQRNYDGDRLVRNEIVPGAEWVIAGDGVATRKWDGTCCMVRDGILYKRYDAKAFTIGNDGQKQPWNRKPPENWEAAQEPDEVTGHWPGWVPVGDEPDSRWHRQALQIHVSEIGVPPNGTYELVGPKIQGNPERFSRHELLPHANSPILGCAPRDYEGLRNYFDGNDIEGIVWHHDDGRMVKIKVKDFGLKRRARSEQEANA